GPIAEVPGSILCLVVAHTCPRRMYRLVRSWRKLTPHLRASVGQPMETCLEIRLLAAFFDAAGDKGGDLLGDRRIKRRRGVFGERALPQLIGLLPGLGRARRLPLLEVAPVGNQRRIEGRRIALKRVLGAEEMSAGAHFHHRLHSEGILAHVRRWAHGLSTKSAVTERMFNA